PSPPFRFMINSPVDGATWEVGSLRSVSWDGSLMPEDSTIDIAVMHHEEKQSFLLRRYVLAQSGSCYLNLPPEVIPGTYSLLLTIYKKRTTVVLGRSLVPVLHIVDKGVLKVPRRVPAPSSTVPAGTSSQGRKETRDERTLLQPSAAIRSKSDGADESLNKETALDVPHARANILLVKNGHRSAESDHAVERVLVTNLDAHTGFYVVLLPMDLSSEEEYRLKIVISGAGRRFVGFSRAFTTTLPAFAE
ncbi:hypothetical protein BGZ70_004611, partial [Mortierella alpina]